jgi:subtilisin-like proprotein convertase family protein
LSAEDSQPVRIPDDDGAGVVRTLSLPAGRTIQEVAVSVDITHPWVGDLRVTLTPPDGTPIHLHDRSGRDADNIVRTWRSQDVPGLQALRGRDAGGSWQLHVADVAQRDEGKLNSWRLEVA